MMRVVLEISERDLALYKRECDSDLGILRDHGAPVAFLNDDLGIAADACDLLAAVDEGENVDSEQLRTAAAHLRDLAESLS